MKFKSDIEVQAGLKDSSGSNGTSGQILSSNGTTVSWVPAGSSVASDVQNEVKAGVAINKGQAVYVTSADGTNIIVGLASNTSEATSSKTLGLLDATVAINGFANVVQIGRLPGLNTIGANAGDPVWLGANGDLIYGLVNKPYAPLHLVFIGIVTRVNANNGEIFVNVQNGFELNEIHDVDIKTVVPVNGDILGYNGTLWVNKTIAGWLGYTPANAATTISTTAPLSGGGDLSTNRTLSITQAGAASNGYLSSTDWNTFNGKQTAINGTGFVKASGTTISYDNSTYTPTSRTITINGVTQDLSANQTWTIAGGVTSFNTRTGAITLTSSDVTTALGYTPYNSTNPNGYTSNLGTVTSIATSGAILGGTITTTGTISHSTADGFLHVPATGTTNNGKVLTAGATAGTFAWQTPASGGVTSVSGAGGYGGLTLTGTVTTTGSLTLGGTPTGTWPISVSGTASGETLATVTGRGATTSTRPSFDGGITVNGQSYITANGYFVSGTAGFRWNDSSGSFNNVIMRDNGTTWFRNYIETPDSARAPIFYDYNNTGYYVDPASTSNLAGLTVANTISGNISGYSNSTYFFNTNFGADIESVTTGGIYRQESPSSGFNYTTTLNMNSSDGRQQLTISRGGEGMKFRGTTTGSGTSWNGWNTVLASNNYSAYSDFGNNNVYGAAFYDANNTGYYLNPASMSNIGGVVADNWFRSIGQTGLYSQTYGLHFAPVSAAAWQITGSGGNIELQFRSNHNSTVRGYVYADTSNNIGFLNNGGGWALRTDSSNNAFVYGTDLTVNTNNSGSSNIYMNDGDEGSRQIHCNSNRIGFLTQAGSWGSYCTDNGDWVTDFISYAGASSRAPIFYDTNNTGYYIDAASTSNLNVVQAAGGFFATSDRRIKENIVTIDKALDKVTALRGVYYNQINSEDKKNSMGVIAQEVLEVVPEVVGKASNGMYNVAYGNLAGLFIEAIKEQQVQIENQQTQIEELKQLVNKLINK